MTPVALLVAFCAAMSAIALGRAVLGETRDPIDVGTALVTVGITIGSALWIGILESWLTAVEGSAVAILGATAIGLGVARIVRSWNDAVVGRGPRCDRDKSSR
ncbi:hypothetical protein [Halopiger thermotolerans]